MKIFSTAAVRSVTTKKFYPFVAIYTETIFESREHICPYETKETLNGENKKLVLTPITKKFFYFKTPLPQRL